MKRVAEVLEGLREDERRLVIELAGVRGAIAALEQVTGIEPERTQGRTQEPSAPPPKNASAPAPVHIPGPYAKASFYEAAALYLSEAGEPKTAREIAEALQAGGCPTRATNFTATVRTMLHRLSARAFGIHPTETGSRWFTRERLSHSSTRSGIG